MDKKSLLNFWLLLLCMIVGSSTAWADEKTFDFKFETIGTTGWSNSYAEHSYGYTEGTVKFNAASKQTGTITTMPVTKGQPVEFVMEEGYTISAATFKCKQWGTKVQTITLHYSTDGGKNYTSTGVTSSNFTITSNNFPDGTNAVKITFNSTSNQVGVESLSLTYSTGGGSSSAVATTTTIDDSGITNTDVYAGTAAGSLSATVVDNDDNEVDGATVTWSGDNDDVAIINATTGAVTLVGKGTVTFTANYAGVENEYESSSDTYEMTVTDSTPLPTYTVTFSDGGSVTQESYGASVTLPSRSETAGYAFAGWSETNVASETTEAPTIIPAGSYTPTNDITLYPVYKKTEGASAPSPFSVGDTGNFAIVSEQFASNKKYYALPTNPTVSSGKITAQEITISELDGVKYVTPAHAEGFTWTIAAATNGYTLSDGTNYVYHSTGGNSGTDLAYGTSTSYTWSFTEDDNFIKMFGMNGSTTNNRGMLFSGTTIGGYSMNNWGSSNYYKTMILPISEGATIYYWSSPVAAAVEKPVITLGANPFLFSTTATITCATDGAAIKYSFDGENWNNYTEVLTITETKTIYAKATKSDDESAVAQVTATKNLAEPTVTVSGDLTLDLNGETNVEAGTLTAAVTYNEAAVEGAAVTWTSSNEDIATINAETGAVTIKTTGTVTFTATYAGNSDYAEATGTKTVTVTDSKAPGMKNNPYTVAQAKYAIDNDGNVTDVYVGGIVSQVDTYNSKNNSITYWISDDGTTTNQFEIYSGKGIGGANFSSKDDIQVGDVVVVKGDITLYNSTIYEFSANNQLVSLVRKPSITATPSPFAAPSYEVGTAEPTYNSFTVNGKNLTADITLTLDENSKFEMSTDLENWASSLTITQNEGSVTDEEVAVRLKAGLEKGNYAGAITLTSTGADNVVIELSGTVTGQTYAISVDDNVTGGTIEADLENAEEGATVTLTATPVAGYTFGSWTVYKDDMSTEVTVTDNQFTMPACEVYVTATFNAIAVTGVTLNKTKITIGIDDTEALTATMVPDNALNKAVTWESNNTDVATVSDGVVTGVAEGNATITVTTEDGSFTATCDVTVVNAVTFDATSDKGTSPLSKNGVSFACDNAALDNGTEYRLYKNSKTTISVTNGRITRIEFIGVSSNPASGFANQSGWTTDGNNGTWEGNSTSVSFTASVAQVRATKIKVFVNITATPTFSVVEGEYDEAKNVELSCATDGATIYYTTNGDIPTSSSTEYTDGISITETTTLKAIAIKDEVESAVASATYTMNRPAAPTFDPTAFVFDTAFDVHLSTETDGATIYYTTNGDTPTSSSTAYDDENGVSISTGSDVTVKAIAFKNGLTSDVASVTYTYDARTTPTFTLSSTELNLKVNETSNAVTLTTNSDGDVEFTCADAHVTLTGTGNSRTISANAAGEYTVNVSVTGSAIYKDAEGTITVTVTKKATTMAISTVFDDGMDLRYASEGLIEGIVKYSNVALDPQPTVTYASSDETVATVNESGVITFKKAGTATLTASYTGDDEYEECEETYDLVLYDTTPQATEVDITFNRTLIGLATTGNTTENVDVSVKNVRIQMNKISGSNYPYGNTDEVRFYNKMDVVFTAPSGYVIKQMEFTKGSKWTSSTSSANTGTWTEGTTTWEGNSNSVTLTFTGTNSFTSGTITLAPVVTLNKYGYATYCSLHPIDFSNVEGFTAWRVSNVSADGTITFSKITETIKEGQGVLLYNKNADGENKTTFTLSVGESEGAREFTTSENKLVGTTAPIVIEANTYYGLSGNKFVKVNAGTVPAGKALLPASEISASARELTFVFNDGTTGISSIENVQLTNDKYYNLNGQFVENPKKGSLYIVNGKKVIMK